VGLGAAVGAGVLGDGLGDRVDVGAAVGVAAATVPEGATVGAGVVTGAALGSNDDDPAGDGVASVLFAHAARRTPRRRDAAWRFAFICRRR
jgi:hypothetical protein